MSRYYFARYYCNKTTYEFSKNEDGKVDIYAYDQYIDTADSEIDAIRKCNERDPLDDPMECLF